MNDKALPTDRATRPSAQAPTGLGDTASIPSADEGEDLRWDYSEDDCECANCGGEGFTYGCSWDWQCETYDEGEGTCLCTRRCEWCSPLTAEELAERKKLQDILATALAKDKIAEIRQEQPK